MQLSEKFNFKKPILSLRFLKMCNSKEYWYDAKARINKECKLVGLDRAKYDLVLVHIMQWASELMDLYSNIGSSCLWKHYKHLFSIIVLAFVSNIILLLIKS